MDTESFNEMFLTYVLQENRGNFFSEKFAWDFLSITNCTTYRPMRFSYEILDKDPCGSIIVPLCSVRSESDSSVITGVVSEPTQ